MSKKAVSVGSVIVAMLAGLLAVACGGQQAGSPPPSPSASGTPIATPSSLVVRTAAATVSGKQETILTDSSGMTLYYYSADKGGKVACTGTCDKLWPPLLVPNGVSAPTATGVTGTLATAANPGGGRIVTYNGWPLYTWVQDTAPGQTTGDMVKDSGGTWFVATPDMASA